MIVATPTGSTAYAAATGASIEAPSVPCYIIAPICPHSLSFRPIMVPLNCSLKVDPPRITKIRLFYIVGHERSPGNVYDANVLLFAQWM